MKDSYVGSFHSIVFSFIVILLTGYSTCSYSQASCPGATDTLCIDDCEKYTWACNGQTYTTSGIYCCVSGGVTKVLKFSKRSELNSGQKIRMTPALPGCPTTDYLATIEGFNTNCHEVYRYCWPPLTASTYNTGLIHPTSGLYVPGSLWNGLPGGNVQLFKVINKCACTPDTSLPFQIIIDTCAKYTLWIEKACGYYTWSVNGQTYTNSGIYTHTAIVAGELETDELLLTINYNTSTVTTASVCGSYTWVVNGITYTTSGTYTNTYYNASCCLHTDSLILTINQPTFHTTLATACDSYTWTCNGMTYTASGTYTCSFVNAFGCLHTETLNLTILQGCVPTISEWGLIILLLISISIGMFFLYRQTYQFAYTGSPGRYAPPPSFNIQLYKKVLIVVIGIATVVLSLSYVYFGSIAFIDIMGTLLCSCLLSLIIQYFLLVKRHESS